MRRQRLRTLTRAGVVERYEDGNRVTYVLSPAGRELAPIVESLGAWGTRWVPELGEEDLDPHLLMWDLHRSLDLDAIPDGRTVLQFTFTDVEAAARDWWVVISDELVDLCDFDPGHPVRAIVEAELRTMVMLWRGDLTWPEALRSGGLTVHAPEQVRRALPSWLKLSVFASVPRPA